MSALELFEEASEREGKAAAISFALCEVVEGQTASIAQSEDCFWNRGGGEQHQPSNPASSDSSKGGSIHHSQDFFFDVWQTRRQDGGHRIPVCRIWNKGGDMYP